MLTYTRTGKIIMRRGDQIRGNGRGDQIFYRFLRKNPNPHADKYGYPPPKPMGEPVFLGAFGWKSPVPPERKLWTLPK